MSDDFYRRFEEAHRGPREVIKQRHEAYRPFFDPIAAIYPGARIIDLGCGRGEWLELMREQGFAVLGVDLDEGMLRACHELDLPVQCEDALAVLAAQPDESMAIVSAFHLVEHLPFDTVRALVKDALRVLKPGGLLILETPNPENPMVGLSSFYMDPTHERPIPQDLLLFVARDTGFARQRIVRLQESPDVAARHDPQLWDVLVGPSPDYAIVAQKSAEASVFNRLDGAFDQAFGLSLHTLATRFEERLSRRFQIDDQSAIVYSHLVERHEEQLNFHISLLESHNERLSELAQQVDHWRQLTEHQAAELVALRTSFSWRITAPVRCASLLIRRALRFAVAQPLLRRSAGLLLRPLPGVRARLAQLAGAASVPLPSVAAPETTAPQTAATDSLTASPELTPRAQQIYRQLVTAAEVTSNSENKGSA